MEELYKHPELGVTFGKFPEPTVEITKKYNCPGPRVRVRQDSSSTEGLNPDAEIPNIVLPDLLNQNNNEEQQEETN